MEILIFAFLIALLLVGCRLIVYSIKEKISAKAYANAEIEILEKQSELEKLRNYKIDVDNK